MSDRLTDAELDHIEGWISMMDLSDALSERELRALIAEVRERRHEDEAKRPAQIPSVASPGAADGPEGG